MKKNFFIFSFIFSHLVFSQDNNFYNFQTLENNNYKTTMRYEDILNFSKATTKLNLYTSSIDLVQYDRSSKIYWDLGSGYVYLSNTWDLEYHIEKNFVIYQKKEGNDKDSNGTQLDFTLRNYLHDFGWLGHEWNHSWGISSSYSDGGDLEYDLFDGKVTDVFLTHRISTGFDNIGLGGSYLSITSNGGGVISSVKNDGYRLNTIISTSTNWGFGFKTFNSLNNEVRDYGHYNNSYLLNFSTVTSWTYELSKCFAFSIETRFSAEKFFTGTKRADRIEFSIFPYIGYNKKLNESFRVFAKVGVTPLSIVKYSNGYDDSGYYARAIAGITYRW